ncbi:dopamine beta-hydroxylase [Peromyscus californicus insignis]|uniref:dopamine beta-hydroxylase n=1 Tax=Peromyscus californicus insignis TaxID=564181 RepID=UPI0022A77B64|nr:dopamine beta-hydroxylase [Peromyscus californicus insignis]
MQAHLTHPHCWSSLPSPSVREAASMYSTAVAIFLVILVAALQSSEPPESSFPYHTHLDPEGILELSWNISYVQKIIHFQLQVQGLRPGVLFGMSDRGEMENADLIMLWTDGNSSYFADAWSDQKGQIHLDAQQDYQLLQAQRTSDGLSLLFKRPFVTCDPKDYLIEDDTVHLVYGILEEPFQSLEAINTSSLNTGLHRVQLLKSEFPTPAMPADVQTIEIRAPDILIPDNETTYWCHVFVLPPDFSERRHHIIKYEAIVTEGNEALVHHMEVFQCADEFESMPQYDGSCYSKMKPERLNYCRHVLAAWALGAEAFYYPEEAGVAVGGLGSSRYLRLEIHYHNPWNIQGRHDSSGIRLYYTGSLRKFNAGIMELGLVYTPVMAIPPQETAFVLTGYCTDKCTMMALPPSGIHIFASQLHTHLTGRKVVTVLARNGQERKVVNRDNHYSPHFQEIRMLKKIVSVFPGDVLITSCTYNTEDRKLATVGGFGILEEMCVNYVHYYPQTELELCKSAVNDGYLQKYFRQVNSFNNEEVCTCPQASVPEQFTSVPWNSYNRDMLKALYRFAPISMHCNKTSAVSFQGEWNPQPLPEITSTLKESAPNCPAQQALSHTDPTLVSIKWGRG